MCTTYDCSERDLVAANVWVDQTSYEGAFFISPFVVLLSLVGNAFRRPLAVKMEEQCFEGKTI